MLATGGSAIQAIQVLLDHGVKAERILFLNMIASPEGLDAIWNACPQVRVVSAWVDARLSAQNCIIPGLGDYGDRYYSG
ncbi:uracil phosphoribosyltransferase [Malassezia vespertilionis]|nr:uracil phosphoribosyltransferase [Malassezia vespertilionis]WFD08338.1 uracil phosphoribosyltransferase [Malassezia vespertilionis]